MLDQDQKNDGYDGADFYDCRESEELSHTDPDDAIQDYLDDLLEPGLTREQARARLPGTLTVTALRRRTVSESNKQYFADTALDDTLERLDDEYGGEAITHATPRMKAAARAFSDAIAAEYTPWQCERVAEREIDVQQWLAENPDFLEDLPESASAR
jgi:hypothetical protein